MLLVLVFCSMLLQVGCKKSYPKDIPDWLKDKIKKFEKANRGKGCGDICRRWDEYSDGTNTTFWFRGGSTMPSIAYGVHDYDGNKQCTYYTVGTDTVCGNIDDIHTYSFVRNIWIQDRSGNWP